jgi:hypothetical protein
MTLPSSAPLLTLLLLVGAAGAVLVAEERGAGRQQDCGEAFQRLVGGVGFGPALDLSGCALGFDPRLDDSCAEDDGPIPGGACFCPRHAGSIFFYPPLDRATSLPAEGSGNEPLP